MSRLILLRHGNTFEEGAPCVQIGSQTDLPLTSFGKEQIKKIAEALIKTSTTPHRFFSGPLKRHKESMEILARSFQSSYEVIPALNEIDYGPWEGLSIEEIEKKWPQESREWSMESKWQPSVFKSSFEEHFKQLHDWFETLSSENLTIVAVTSGGILRLLHRKKVKTAHLCELFLSSEKVEQGVWGVGPDEFCSISPVKTQVITRWAF